MFKKHTLLYIVILFFFSNIYAQNKIDIGVGIDKPSLIFSNFFYKYYENQFDFDFRITIHKSEHFIYGTKFNFGYYQNPNKTIAFNSRPKIFVGYKSEEFYNTNYYLIFSTGYNNVQLNNEKYNYKENFSGICADIELQFVYMTKFNFGIYTFATWEHSYFPSDNFSKLQYFKHSNMLMLGIGIKYQLTMQLFNYTIYH